MIRSELDSTQVTRCQICDADNLNSVLFLGYVSPVNAMPDIGAIESETAFHPLELLRCGQCGLVQIGVELPPSILFPFSYPYLSGTTQALKDNFADLFVCTREFLEGASDLVLDIGSNDGSLLSNFHSAGYQVLGVEPSQASNLARERGINTIVGYFDRQAADNILATRGKAQLICATNVFAHIGDPHAVVQNIVSLLGENGVFVNESHYLLSLIDSLQYDTIYHEHLRYYHLGSMIRLLESHDLEVFRVQKIGTHGGSIRVFSGKKGLRPVESSVLNLLQEEIDAGLTDGRILESFRDQVSKSKVRLYELLAPIKKAGKRIFGVGAPSRASTLISYVGLDESLIECVVEVSGSNKLGKNMPGTIIPVLNEQILIDEQPDYALIFSWHIAEPIIKNLRKKGFKGSFIVPLPDPKILS